MFFENKSYKKRSFECFPFCIVASLPIIQIIESNAEFLIIKLDYNCISELKREAGNYSVIIIFSLHFGTFFTRIILTLVTTCSWQLLSSFCSFALLEPRNYIVTWTYQLTTHIYSFCRHTMHAREWKERESLFGTRTIQVDTDECIHTWSFGVNCT